MRNIDLNSLSELTPLEVADLPSGVLADLQSELADAAKDIRDKKATFDAGLEHKYLETAKAQLLSSGNDTGTTHIDDGGFDVSVALPKKISWDQSVLIEIFNAMEPAEAEHYAKASYKVDERKYDAAPPSIRSRLSEARTLDTGKPVFKFTGGAK